MFTGEKAVGHTSQLQRVKGRLALALVGGCFAHNGWQVACLLRLHGGGWRVSVAALSEAACPCVAGPCRWLGEQLELANDWQRTALKAEPSEPFKQGNTQGEQ